MKNVQQQHWQERLRELAERHQVPGAALAIWSSGELTEACAGVLNVKTQVETTPDSLFQIGSVTKPYTATLIMQLVEEGRLDLDEPLVRVLPELRLGDAEATAQVTMSHLLDHTSGIQGDFFDDFGRGDDVLSRFVEGCADLGFSHPVGATMSYCNTGYVLAGRVIELLTGRTWDQALHERLLAPAGLRHTVTLPEEALRFRAAHGHVAEPGEQPHLAPVWGLPRCLGPAGLVCATASDMVAFGRMHLDGGRSADGVAVLPERKAAAMTTEQVRLPDPWTLGAAWGLGWTLYDWDGRRLHGHDGNTLGQSAFLRVVPDSDVVVGLVANGGRTRELYRALFAELMAQLCDLRMPPALEPPPEPPAVDAAPLAGHYERVARSVDLTADGATLTGRIALTGPLAELDANPVQEVRLVPVTDRVFVTRDDENDMWTPVVFYELEDGSRYLHMGGRATPRVETGLPASA